VEVKAETEAKAGEMVEGTYMGGRDWSARFKKVESGKSGFSAAMAGKVSKNVDQEMLAGGVESIEDVKHM
jgi:hypothetical protein